MDQVTFIGGGNMANAIIGGLLAKQAAPAALRVVEIEAAARARLEQKFPGIRCFDHAQSAIRPDDVILLAVKPQQMRVALATLRLAPDSHLLVSIAAGLDLATLGRWCGGYRRMVRAMPNTPALVGEGITALYAEPSVDSADRSRAEAIMAAVGSTVWVGSKGGGEDIMNAVTAISGSGPAYVFLFMEAMEQAARELKLPPEVARLMVMQTFAGAARLAGKSEEAVSTLRERVTSKGGTTEAALASMAREQVKAAIVRAVHAANERGRELGRELGKD